MGVRFVIGRAGSGKTLRCTQRIAAALRDRPMGPPVYWILPKQATFTAERELTCTLGGFCRARVLSFDELGREILGECGGSAIPRITRLGRQMVLGHLLRKHESQLRLFGKVARQPGMAAQLESTFAEFDRCGRDPRQIEVLVKELSAENDADADSLRNKLHDVLLIYKAYTDYLGQDHLDERLWINQVLSCISRSRRFAGATIYVDCVSEFEDLERRMLARLGKICAEMEITLLMDGGSPVLRDANRAIDDLSTFHPVEDAYRRLAKAFADDGVALDEPIILPAVRRFAAPALAEIERSFFDAIGRSNVAPDGIELVEAPNRRTEVEHAAGRIRNLLRGGTRMRQIALLVRNMEMYADLIGAVFREHEIPFFIDRRRHMAHHPLLQLARAAINIVRHNWPHDAVMTLIKSGLAGLDNEQADRLENYVLEHHLRGRVWAREEPWNWDCGGDVKSANEPLAGRTPQAAAMDALRRKLVSALSSLASRFPDDKATQTVRQTVAAIYELFDALDAPGTLTRWILREKEAGHFEQAGEHERVWAELADLMDQMVDLLGDQPVTLADFQEILEAGLETFELAMAPPTVDQVLVGQVDRTRPPEIKALLVLGMNEGVFPSAPIDRSILSDPERMELERRRFELSAGTERRLLDETFFAYVTFTRPSELLYVSRTMADEKSRALPPSPYWHRLREMFPTLQPVVAPRSEQQDARLISTPRQLLTGLMRWARESDQGGAWPALYRWLCAYPTNDDAIDRLRYRAWRAMLYENRAAFSPAAGKSLFSSPLNAGVRQIEIFANCPFKHFLRYGLVLEERDEEDSIRLDLETAFHQVLENLVRDLLRKHGDWSQVSAEQSQQLVRVYAQRIERTLRGELMLGNSRNRYLLTRIEKALTQIIASQQAIAQCGQFKTAFGRIVFGAENAMLPPLIIATEFGREVQLTGHIDRVDLLEKAAAFSVFDYRLWGDKLDLWRVYHGLTLQLLTHMLVLQEHGEKLVGRPISPAAAFYIRLLRQLDEVDHPEDAASPEDPRFAIGGRQRGIFDAGHLRDLDNTKELDVLAAHVNRDGEFGNRNNTDVAEGDELPALLNYARRQIGNLADRILDGEIDIRPYKVAGMTPCPSCAYRSVCRFDAAVNRYRHIGRLSREDVLRKVCDGGVR